MSGPFASSEPRVTQTFRDPQAGEARVLNSSGDKPVPLGDVIKSQYDSIFAALSDLHVEQSELESVLVGNVFEVPHPGRPSEKEVPGILNYSGQHNDVILTLIRNASSRIRQLRSRI